MVTSSYTLILLLGITSFVPPSDTYCSRYAVRIVNGSSPNSGRVELCYSTDYNGRDNLWGTVCGNNWGDNEASVVCRQLGYSGGVAVSNAAYGEGTGGIWLHDVNCVGSEDLLVNCRSQPYGHLYCDHSEDAGVICTATANCAHGAIRVVGSYADQQQRGRVEICVNNQWGTVCDDVWDNTDATVVCRQLGYLRGGSAVPDAFYGEGTGPILLDKVNCSGSEQELIECSASGIGDSDCSHSDDAGVYCLDDYESPTAACSDGAIELYRYNTRSIIYDRYKGRVEVCIGGLWRTVCDNGWDNNDASVVCRQLGYYGGIAVPDAYYGRGRGRIMLDEVNCDGSEQRLVDCPANSDGNNNCNHLQDASVICTPYAGGMYVSDRTIRIITGVTIAMIALFTCIPLCVIFGCYYSVKNEGKTNSNVDELDQLHAASTTMVAMETTNHTQANSGSTQIYTSSTNQISDNSEDNPPLWSISQTETQPSTDPPPYSVVMSAQESEGTLSSANLQQERSDPPSESTDL